MFHLRVHKTWHIDSFHNFSGLGVDFYDDVLQEYVGPYKTVDILELIEVFYWVSRLVRYLNAVFHLKRRLVDLVEAASSVG